MHFFPPNRCSRSILHLYFCEFSYFINFLMCVYTLWMFFENSTHCCLFKGILCNALNDKNVTSTKLKNLDTKMKVKMNMLRFWACLLDNMNIQGVIKKLLLKRSKKNSQTFPDLQLVSLTFMVIIFRSL